MASRFWSLAGRAWWLKCPRCGSAPLFRRPFSMYANCPCCGLDFEPEPGYFVGAIYVNYAATVLVAVPGYFLLDAWAGLSLEQQLAVWISFAVLFPVLFFHHSRSLWLGMDHLLNPAKSLYPVPRKPKR
ncbi:MAG TPA: DUF983 domain-containing protein [candidate division Zixibacteria bacterium]|nr:DUF983 domain-containing protein [candidate division Zixibacteria bacterium]